MPTCSSNSHKATVSARAALEVIEITAAAIAMNRIALDGAHCGNSWNLMSLPYQGILRFV
jgi:hypothetical protein